jgi:hypothetical protein
LVGFGEKVRIEGVLRRNSQLGGKNL